MHRGSVLIVTEIELYHVNVNDLVIIDKRFVELDT